MEKYLFRRVLLIVSKLRKVNERKQGHYVSGQSLLYNGGSRSCAKKTLHACIKRLPKTVFHNGSGTRTR